MKILFLSNFYPPASRGGFEEWCREVLEGLRARGHEVQVLTSNFGSAHQPDPVWVHRELALEMEFSAFRNALQFFTSRKERERKNLACLRKHVEDFQPGAVLIWGMWNLHRSIPCLAEELSAGRVVYYMGDYWPALPGQLSEYWEAPARRWISNLPKSLLRPLARRILLREKPPAPRFEQVLFPSIFMQHEFERLGFSPKYSQVVYGAIDTGPYLKARDPRRSKGYCSLLYVGRLSQEKGVHTAIKALGHLVHTLDIRNVRLTIVGSGDPDLEDRLRQLVREEGISTLVAFMPAQPKERLPEIYHDADILIFPSIWAEPFGRVIVEAMASGLAVVGTCVGGASELLVEGETALTFLPGDPVGLAGQLRRLIVSPDLRDQLGGQSRQFVVNRFNLPNMTAGIESHLAKLVEQ